MKNRIIELIEEAYENTVEVKKISIEGEFKREDKDFPLRNCHFVYGFCTYSKNSDDFSRYCYESFLYERKRLYENGSFDDNVCLFSTKSNAALQFLGKVAYEVSEFD